MFWLHINNFTRAAASISLGCFNYVWSPHRRHSFHLEFKCFITRRTGYIDLVTPFYPLSHPLSPPLFSPLGFLKWNSFKVVVKIPMQFFTVNVEYKGLHCTDVYIVSYWSRVYYIWFHNRKDFRKINFCYLLTFANKIKTYYIMQIWFLHTKTKVYWICP